MKRYQQKASWLGAMVFFVISSHAASATLITPKDIQAISNSLKYVHGLTDSGSELKIAAVYDASVPESRQDADAFVSQLATASRTKSGVALKGEIISVQELRSHPNLAVVYVAQGLTASYAAIAAQAKEKHFLTVGRGLACAESNCCVLAVDTTDAINIYLNERALQAAGFDVDAAFKFMVKRV